MECWYFTEMPYPHLPPMSELTTHWVSLSNQLYDPKVGADLYNRYFDEYLVADDAGLHLMVNEHHQTATCLDVAGPLSLAILARQTSKGRICILGNPIANRGDPIRIAEEMAMVDCISRGRVSAGFVRHAYPRTSGVKPEIGVISVSCRPWIHLVSVKAIPLT